MKLFALILFVLFLSCNKQVTEPPPADKRIKERLDSLQGWCKPVDGQCGCQVKN